MDTYTMNIILSWVKFIASLGGIALALWLFVKAWKYIRAILKRFSFMHRLKKTCREEGVKMQVLSSPYSSVFKPSDTSELLLDKDGELYSVKFFPCINAKDTYQFDEEGSYYTISNFKPIFLNMRFYSTGAHSPASTRVLLPKTLQYNSKLFKNSAKANFTEADIHGAKPLLCLNPIAVQMQKVKGSNVVTIFDGDELCGYTVYSAGGLLKFIAN